MKSEEPDYFHALASRRRMRAMGYGRAQMTGPSQAKRDAWAERRDRMAERERERAERVRAHLEERDRKAADAPTPAPANDPVYRPTYQHDAPRLEVHGTTKWG